MTPASLLPLLQLADGLFPAGGFAHSFGLETYVQDGHVHDLAGLAAFVTAHLEGAAGPADAVAVAVAARAAAAASEAGGVLTAATVLAADAVAVATRATAACTAYAAGAAPDSDSMATGLAVPAGTVPSAAWIALDRRLDAMKCVPEFRAASRQMGRQTLRVAVALRDDPALMAFARAADEGDTPAHHAVAFGATLGTDGVAPEAAAAAFLYSTTVLLVGAGLRLISLGQVDGQRVIARMRPRIARLAATAAMARAEDMWSFTPALDIAGIRHETLETRLFRS